MQKRPTSNDGLRIKSRCNKIEKKEAHRQGTVLFILKSRKYVLRAGPQLRVDAYGVRGCIRSCESASSLPRRSFCTLLRRPHGPLPAPSPSLADASILQTKNLHPLKTKEQLASNHFFFFAFSQGKHLEFKKRTFCKQNVLQVLD